jgi:hypothetical protein
VPHGRPTWVKIDICSLCLVRADSRLFCKTQKSGVVPCGVVRSGWFFNSPTSHGPDCAGLAEQCAERSTRTCRCDYPLVVHGSARYGAYACLVVHRLHGCSPILVCTTPGPTRGDVPGYCGVVEKAERGTNALRWILFVIFWCCICEVVCTVRLDVACTFMHFAPIDCL